MDNYKKQQIIQYLSQWILIHKVGTSKENLIIEGSLRNPDTDLNSIKKDAGKLIGEITQHSTNGHTYFRIKPQQKKKKSNRMNLILFFITIITTLAAGALMEGANIFKNPLLIYKGIPFSLTLMLILGVHELGHYTFAKKHNVDATLPYFIPAPTFIGTFGAFIKMKSPIHSKKALIEIGAAGPIAGFIIAVPALFIGLSISEIQTVNGVAGGLQLGDSLLTWAAAKIMYPHLAANQEIMISSVGFAAWIGLLVTMLNLIPLGQLDGGHIAYALLGDKFKKVGWVIFIGLVLLGTIPYFLFDVNTLNWLIWAALVFFVIKLKHPPVLNPGKELTTREKTIGIIALTIFILTFVPVPISA
ncbi:MAG: site-2 protease family protein [Candidatus Marinimicrobia bacterium]|nr:site-2 protease family protein [Candidatus Neomarinimicrobiota bacterium]